jgi:hypothetical protein
LDDLFATLVCLTANNASASIGNIAGAPVAGQEVGSATDAKITGYNPLTPIWIVPPACNKLARDSEGNCGKKSI